MNAKQEHNLAHLQIYIQLGSKQDPSIAFSKHCSPCQLQSQVTLTPLKTQNSGSVSPSLWFEIKSQWYLVFSPETSKPSLNNSTGTHFQLEETDHVRNQSSPLLVDKTMALQNKALFVVQCEITELDFILYHSNRKKLQFFTCVYFPLLFYHYVPGKKPCISR